MPSPLVRVPASIRGAVLTLSRLEREGLPVQAALEQAIASLQAVNSPVNSRPSQSVIDDLIQRVEALEQLTALLTLSGVPVNSPVNSQPASVNTSVSRPVNQQPQSVNSSGEWLTVDEAWAIAVERGCPASLSSFRRWARGNAKYPDGDEAALQRWGFSRDSSRATEGNPKNPARFLRSVPA